MDRRAFMYLAGASAGASAFMGYQRLFPQAQAASFELATGYGDWRDSSIEVADPPLPSELVLINPGNMKMRHFPVPFRVHVVVQNPSQPEELILISKWGEEICSFSLRTGKISRTQRAESGRRFFGHAVWDSTENGFWASEHDDPTSLGFLVLRGSDLQIRRKIPSHGMFPHDVQLAGAGLIAVANNGDFYGYMPQGGRLAPELRISNLSWVKTSDGSLQRQVRFPELLQTAGVSHFHFIPGSEEIFIGGKTAREEQKAVVIRLAADNSYKFIEATAESADHFRGEALSFAVDTKENRVLWTHSKEKGLFYAELSGGPARLVTPSRSRGIASVGDAMLITHASKQLILRYRDGKVADEFKGPKIENYRWGSHLTKVAALVR